MPNVGIVNSENYIIKYSLLIIHLKGLIPFSSFRSIETIALIDVILNVNKKEKLCEKFNSDIISIYPIFINCSK